MTLSEKMLTDTPYPLFETWFNEAKEKEPNDPNAMALGTVDADGMPAVRMVLLKDWDETGFVFYTNLSSRKGKALKETPQAALCFHWKSLCRQIRIEGHVEQVADKVADAYFHSRHRGSQIGAWASNQSSPLDSRETLKERVAMYEEKFKDQDVIPRPPHWSGFRVKPIAIEFWDDGEYRLHDRFRYTKNDSGAWQAERLYP